MFVLLNMTQWNRWVQSGVRAGAELPSPPSAACLFSSTLTKAVWSIPAETSNQEKWFCASVPLCPQILSWLMNLHLGSMKYKPEIGREVLQTWLGAMHLLLTLELAAQEFKQTWAVWVTVVGTAAGTELGLCDGWWGGSVTLIQHFLLL